MAIRRIAGLFQGKRVTEGAGVRLSRAFGYAQVPHFDPFLMLDDFHTADPADYLAGFPWHPHRGIETITYVIDGLVEHGDSLGNSGAIRSGEVQWMTAGSGIIHQEMPKETPSGVLWGFQLWANLPARDKMTHPRYRDVRAGDIPEATLENGARIKVISGRVAGVEGPVRDIVIDPELFDVLLPAGASFEHSVPEGHTAIAYVMDGQGRFGGWPESGPAGAPSDGLADARTAVLYERAGGAVRIAALASGPLRFVFISGKPLGEPVAWGGPIVMNTREELDLAFEELDRGTFIKHA